MIANEKTLHTPENISISPSGSDGDLSGSDSPGVNQFAGSDTLLEPIGYAFEEHCGAAVPGRDPDRPEPYVGIELPLITAEFEAMARALTRVYGVWPLSVLREAWRHGVHLRPGQGLVKRLCRAGVIESLDRQGYRAMTIELNAQAILEVLKRLPVASKSLSRAKSALYLVARHILGTETRKEPSAVRLKYLRSHLHEVDLSDLLVLGQGEVAPDELLEVAGDVAEGIAGAKGHQAKRAREVARTNARYLFDLLVLASLVARPEETGPRCLPDHPWPKFASHLAGGRKHASIRTVLMLRALREASVRPDLTPENAEPKEWRKAFDVLTTMGKDGRLKMKTVYSVRTHYRKVMHPSGLLASDAPQIPHLDARNVWQKSASDTAAAGDFTGIKSVCPGLASGRYSLRTFRVAFLGTEAEKAKLGLPKNSSKQLHRARKLDRRPKTKYLSESTVSGYFQNVARVVTWARDENHIKRKDLSVIDLRHILLDIEPYGIVVGEERVSISAAWLKAHPAKENSRAAVQATNHGVAVVCSHLARIAGPCLANAAEAKGKPKLAEAFVCASDWLDERSQALGTKPFEGETNAQAVASTTWLAARQRYCKSRLIHVLGQVRVYLEKRLLSVTNTATLDDLIDKLKNSPVTEPIDTLVELMVVLMACISYAFRPEEIVRLQVANIREEDLEVVIAANVRKNWTKYNNALRPLPAERFSDPSRGSYWDSRIWRLWLLVREDRLAGRESTFAFVPRKGGEKGRLRRRGKKNGRWEVVGTGVRHSTYTLGVLTKAVISAIRKRHRLTDPAKPAGKGLRAPGYNLYVIRHAVATARLALGQPINEVALLLGHTREMTELIYDGQTAKDIDYDEVLKNDDERVDEEEVAFAKAVEELIVGGMSEAGAEDFLVKHGLVAWLGAEDRAPLPRARLTRLGSCPASQARASY